MSETPSKSGRTFYVTTPIYYVNARPHIGHAYTTVAADVLARRHRLLGNDVFFLTGTDEHGQKIERSARAAGIEPQRFADEVSASFRSLWKRMGILDDTLSKDDPLLTRDFIRTTESRHKERVQHLFTELQRRGAIYKSTYTGQYCVHDESYVDGPPGIRCPDCGRVTETVSEENYYFRLSAFQQSLLNLIEPGPNGEPPQLQIQPDSRRNEVLSFLRGNIEQAIYDVRFDAIWNSDPVNREEAYKQALERGVIQLSSPSEKFPSGAPFVPGALKDLSISRTSFSWGIPVPGDEKHVIYVWLDALANYMTAIGYGSDSPADQALFQKFWPADLHLVGKEIIRFHCVYWPAFLLALNDAYPRVPADQLDQVGPEPLPELTPEQHRIWAEKWLPRAVTAHGWLLFEESKMSKSRGNIVRTETILDAFGPLCPTGISLQGAASESQHAPADNSRKGTASAVPYPTTKNPALAAEVSSPPNLQEPGRSRGLQVPERATPTEGVSAAGLSPEATRKHEGDLFASDVLRYFLLREIPFGRDGGFSFDALIQRYNSDLANGYGNLVSRTLNLIQQNCSSMVPTTSEPWLCESPAHWNPEDARPDLRGLFQGTKQVISAMSNNQAQLGPMIRKCDFDQYLGSLQYGIGIVDLYISAQKPWNLAKLQDQLSRRKLEEVLYTAAESIRILTALLYPILPYSTGKVWAQLGLGDIEQAARNGELKDLQWGGLKPGTPLGPLAPIFPRAPKELAQIMTDIEAQNTPARSATPDDLTAVTADNDASTSETTEFAEAPLSSEQSHHAPAPSRFSNETTSAAPADPTDSTHPGAAPRSSGLRDNDPITQVGGSFSPVPALARTPSHTEAQASGLFAGSASGSPIPQPSGSPQQPSSGEPATSGVAPFAPQITIDDFIKLDLRVARIVVAERIPKADKLLRLEVDLGSETRQILSGIAEWYTPEELLGRRIVVIANLAPRKMRGLDSHGMLLAASHGEGGKPILATFAEGDDIPPGARLK